MLSFLRTQWQHIASIGALKHLKLILHFWCLQSTANDKKKHCWWLLLLSAQPKYSSKSAEQILLSPTIHPIEKTFLIASNDFKKLPCHSGPSPGFSSRVGQKTDGGAKNYKRGHIFKIQYWMYAATGGPNVKWGAPISYGGAGNHWPHRWRRPWCHWCMFPL